MNSIRNFMQNKDSRSAERYLTSFAKLIRYTLDNSETQEVSLEAELQALKNYAELEMQRFEQGFDFTIECEEGLDLSEYSLPSLLLQPFVENSIKHGIGRLDKGGKISLKISKQGIRTAYHHWRQRCRCKCVKGMEQIEQSRPYFIRDIFDTWTNSGI